MADETEVRRLRQALDMVKGVRPLLNTMTNLDVSRQRGVRQTLAWLCRQAGEALGMLDGATILAAPAPAAAILDGIRPEDAEYLLLAAVRYQLPRMTYGSGIVGGLVVRCAPRMSPAYRAILARDIGEALRRGEAGQDCDRDEWARAFAALTGGPA